MARRKDDQAFLNSKFVAVTTLASLLVGLALLFAGISEQVAVLGVLVSSLFGLQLNQIEYLQQRNRHQLAVLGTIGLRQELLSDPEFLLIHTQMCKAISRLAACGNPSLRRQALTQLNDLNSKIRQMSRGKLVYENTETWRTVYEELLTRDDVREYRSVAWFRTNDYWQDKPGQQSLALNLRRAADGLLTHRTVIIPESLWAKGSLLPASPLCEWIEKQHVHGIWVELVREAEIGNEPDLLVDFGIYGDVAIGKQMIDQEGRTLRYELSFLEEDRSKAEQIWKRLLLFSTSYADLLDQEGNLS